MWQEATSQMQSLFMLFAVGRVHRVAPLILIAIGALVMHEAGSFALLFHHAH